MRTLPEGDLYARFIDRVQQRKPFSFVRMGDGEVVVLRYPGYESLQAVQAQFTRWWREPIADHQTAMTLRAHMLSAFRSADMLGVPHEGEQLRYPKWNVGARFDDLMRTLALPGRGDTDVFYFYHLINLNNTGVLTEALRGKRLRLITCRPECAQYTREHFDSPEVQTHLIRAEAFRWKPYASLDAAAEASAAAPPHWPEGYTRAREWIRAGGDGWVYLIGAGGPGKVYADDARRAGSIGIDIGALFDGWAQHPTRPYLEGVKR